MSYDVGMLPRGALKMFNGRQKWREKTGNDAGNGILIIKARFSSYIWASCYYERRWDVAWLCFKNAEWAPEMA